MVKSTFLNPLVEKALNKSPFDFFSDGENIKSYLNELLTDKNLLLAFKFVNKIRSRGVKHIKI